MEQNGLRIGSFAGAPIIVDWTVAILAGYIVFSDFSRGGVAELPSSIVFIAALFVAILLHEIGHTAMAAAFRIRCSAIVLTFFGGQAMLTQTPAKRWQDMAVSAAGPAVNLALAAFFTFAAPQTDGYLGEFIRQSAFVNLLLGLFNLLPGYPLDGGHIMRAFLSYFLRTARARWIVAWLGVIIATALGLWGITNGMLWTAGIGLLLALQAFSEVNAAQAVLGSTRRWD